MEDVLYFTCEFCYFSTIIPFMICCYGILFINLHRTIDKFNDYDSGIHH